MGSGSANPNPNPNPNPDLLGRGLAAVVVQLARARRVFRVGVARRLEDEAHAPGVVQARRVVTRVPGEVRVRVRVRVRVMVMVMVRVRVMVRVKLQQEADHVECAVYP